MDIEYNTTNASSITDTIIMLLPIFLIILPLYRLYCWVFGEPIDYKNYEPEEVLKMRYVKGEISSLYYLERMSRL